MIDQNKLRKQVDGASSSNSSSALSILATAASLTTTVVATQDTTASSSHSNNIPLPVTSCTPQLILAILQGNTATAKALIKEKRDLTWKDANLEGALIYAIKACQKEIVEELLKLDCIDASEPNILGQTPLHFASRCSDFGILQLLIDKKVLLSTTDNNQRSALMYALSKEYLLNADILIDAGIDVNLISNKGEHALFTALSHIAKLKYHSLTDENATCFLFKKILFIVKKLLLKGCFMDGRYQPTPDGPFMTIDSTLSRLEEIFEGLFQNPPQFSETGSSSTKPQGKNLWTNLETYENAKTYLREIIDTLHNAQILHQDLENNNPDLREENYLEFQNIQYIVNARRIVDGKTPLHIALLKKQFFLIGDLLEAGANARLADFSHCTAFELMSDQLKAFRKLYQLYLIDLDRLCSTLEKDYSLVEKSYSRSKDRSEYEKGKAWLGKKHLKVFDQIEQLASACLTTIEQTYGDKENEEVFALLRGKICHQLSAYFFNPDKERPWHDANFVRKVLFKVPKGSPLYTSAQHQLFLLASYTGNIHHISSYETPTRDRLLHYINSIQLLDANCKAEHQNTKNALFSQNLARYMTGSDSAAGVAIGIPDVTGLNAESLMAVFDWMKGKLQEKDKSQKSEAQPLSGLQKTNNAEAASSSSLASSSSAILHMQSIYHKPISHQPSTSFAASAASSSTASVVHVNGENSSNGGLNTRLNSSSTVVSPRKRKSTDGEESSSKKQKAVA